MEVPEKMKIFAIRLFKSLSNIKKEFVGEPQGSMLQALLLTMFINNIIVNLGVS